MSFQKVECTDIKPPEDPFGQFANALRMTIDGSEILLDFCAYSAETNSARVVSRVRVSAPFLQTIHQKIGASFTNSILEDELFLLPPLSDPS